MKRLFASVVCLLFIAYCFLFIASPQSDAQTLFPSKAQSKPIDIVATVGRFYLSIQGYQSPYASIVMTTQSGIFMRSAVADSKGYFTISDILITDTFSGFCLTAIDFKRIGQSDACIDIDEEITGNITRNDIFLPPTIGLSKKQINAGQNALIYGYTMPNADVALLIDGKPVSLKADATGYYAYEFKNVPAGTYTFTASATLEGKESLPPLHEVSLEALSIPSQITNTVKETGENLAKKYRLDLVFLGLLALILLIIIGLLLYKLRVRLMIIIIDKFRHRHKMHHDWFLDLY